MQQNSAAADGSDEGNIGSPPLKQVGSASDALSRDDEHGYYRPLGGGCGDDKKGRSKSLSGALGGYFGLRRDITTSTASSGGGGRKGTTGEGGSGDVSVD